MDIIEENTLLSGSFVKAAMVLIVGVILLSGFVGGIANNNPKSATITLTEIPTDGNTITLGGHIFEFDSDGSVSPGHVSVTIGNTLYDTCANLRAAIAANTDYTLS